MAVKERILNKKGRFLVVSVVATSTSLYGEAAKPK